MIRVKNVRLSEFGIPWKELSCCKCVNSLRIFAKEFCINLDNFLIGAEIYNPPAIFVFHVNILIVGQSTGICR